jgi:hypothetical protein
LAQCTEVPLASFLSGGFITVIAVNPLEKKLAKRTSATALVYHCKRIWLPPLYTFSQNQCKKVVLSIFTSHGPNDVLLPFCNGVLTVVQFPNFPMKWSVQIILGWNWYQIDKSQQDEAEQPNDK